MTEPGSHDSIDEWAARVDALFANPSFPDEEVRPAHYYERPPVAGMACASRHPDLTYLEAWTAQFHSLDELAAAERHARYSPVPHWPERCHVGFVPSYQHDRWVATAAPAWVVPDGQEVHGIALYDAQVGGRLLFCLEFREMIIGNDANVVGEGYCIGGDLWNLIEADYANPTADVVYLEGGPADGEIIPGMTHHNVIGVPYIDNAGRSHRESYDRSDVVLTVGDETCRVFKWRAPFDEVLGLPVRWVDELTDDLARDREEQRQRGERASGWSSAAALRRLRDAYRGWSDQ